MSRAADLAQAMMQAILSAHRSEMDSLGYELERVKTLAEQRRQKLIDLEKALEARGEASYARGYKQAQMDLSGQPLPTDAVSEAVSFITGKDQNND